MANTYRVNYFNEIVETNNPRGSETSYYHTSAGRKGHSQAFVSASSGDQDTLKSVLTNNGVSSNGLMISQVSNADLAASKGAPVLL